MSSVEDRAQEVGRPVRETAQAIGDAGSDVGRTAREAGADVASTAHDASAEVVRTATAEAQRVARTAASQAQQVGAGVRQLVRGELDRQHRQAVDQVGSFAEQLYAMAAERPDTPAGELVETLAARSRSFATYLDEHGPEQVVRELQDFARRRPGIFILAAVATGFVAGRLGKGLWQNRHESPRP